MSWVPNTDTFDYHSYESLSNLECKELKLTKRGIYSIIPRIYDPTGLLSPFILKGKLILQSALVQKDIEDKSLGWDDQPPEEIKNRWLKWIKEIKEAAKFHVHRYIFKNASKIPSVDQLELHGFADAGDLAQLLRHCQHKNVLLVEQTIWVTKLVLFRFFLILTIMLELIALLHSIVFCPGSHALKEGHASR